MTIQQFLLTCGIMYVTILVLHGVVSAITGYRRGSNIGVTSRGKGFPGPEHQSEGGVGWRCEKRATKRGV